MKAHEVPTSLLAVRCLRCQDVLAVPHDLTREQRNEIATEHHLYLCSCPTPNVALWRRLGFPDPGPHVQPGTQRPDTWDE